MQRRELPQGYIEGIIAHNDPLQPEPPPPIIERKQAQTLMGHCLKQFIRERLYGNLVNYARHQVHSNVTSLGHSLLPNIRPNQASKTHMLPNVLLKTDATRRENNHRYSSYAKSSLASNKGQQTIPTVRYNRSSLSSLEKSLEQSLLEKTKINPHRASLLSNNLSHPQKPVLSNSRNKSLSNSQQPYQISSFISAVQDLDRNERLFNRKEKRLMPLDLGQKLEKVKNNKKMIAADRFTVNSNTWDLFCRKQGNISGLLEENTQRNPLAKSAATKAGSTLEKSKVFNVKSSFTKQAFLAYLSNLLLVPPLLPEFAFQFFQLNNKISDNITVEDYKGAVQRLATAGPRLWSILAFRFWDQDRNGVIDSNDIFEIYKKLDQAKSQLEQRRGEERSRGIMMIKALLNQLETLRQKISSLDKQRKMAVNNMLQKAQNSGEGVYLQESLLRKRDLSYSQLELVLGQNMKQDGKDQKHSVIQSAKDLGIKFSSCYRYSFMATDHNEETRENREYIERMKEELKQEKEVSGRNKEELIQQALPVLTYPLFVGIKQIIIEVFAMQMQYK